MPDYPFRSDGCSGGMTWLYRVLFKRNPPWNGCCVEHDRAYHKGGTKHERAWADTGLLIAVAQKGHPLVAILMWLAVRVGGHWILPLPWRWGYGWRFPHPYTKEPTT